MSMTSNIEKMRPSDLRNAFLEQAEIDGRAFYKAWNNQFIDIPCPVCDEIAEKSEFIKWNNGGGV